MQELKPIYQQAGRTFSDYDFHKKNLFTDEAPFWLYGYVNKDNYRILNEDCLQAIIKKSLFDMLYDVQKISLVHISSKVKPATMLQSIWNAI